MKNMLGKSGLILSVLVFMIWGCDSNVSEPDPPEEPPMEDPRIVFGETIDGILIGDDTTAVIEKAGIPDEIQRGDFAGVAFLYNEGDYAGLVVTIATETEDNNGVQGVGAWPPYVGKSKEGIGLGSTRSEVIEQLGDPEDLGDVTQGSKVDAYLFQDTFFLLSYPDSSQSARLESVVMRPISFWFGTSPIHLHLNHD